MNANTAARLKEDSIRYQSRFKPIEMADGRHS